MKAPLRYLLPLAALPVQEAHAIRDENGNGLSDVWERHFNGGALFSAGNPAHHAAADPDGDGWTNLEEAVAGTDPFRAEVPHNGVRAAISPHPETPGWFVLSWPTIIGKSYRAMKSADLVEWTFAGPPIAGTGSAVQFTTDTGGSFWRVRVEDTDPDGDTLTTWEEQRLGLDPNHADTDRDGLRDDIDPDPLVSATVADPDGAGLAASLANGLIGRWDCEQLTQFNPTHGFVDQSGNNHSLVCGQTSLSLDPLGMISKAVILNEPRDYLIAPPSLLHGRASFSISFWFKLVPDSIQLNGGHTAFISINGSYDAAPELMVTAFRGVVGSTSQKLFVNGVVGGTLTSFLIAEIPMAEWIDDGKWHHLALTKHNNDIRLYLNGGQKAGGPVSRPAFSMTSTGYVCFGKSIPNTVANGTNLYGSLDRIRCYSRSLGSQEVLALARQDADRDGRTDIAEVNTRVWTDSNVNGKVDPGEVTYTNSPFVWEP